MTTAAAAAAAQRAHKGLHIALWVLQVLVGLAFVASGGMKVFTPIDQMVAQAGANGAWMKEMEWLPRFIGVSELAGGLGLILPAATRILPFLTWLAAALLVVVMVLAVGHHFQINDAAGSIPAAVLGLLCAFIAWGRMKKVPVAPR